MDQVMAEASLYELDVSLNLVSTLAEEEGTLIEEVKVRTYDCRRTQRLRGSCTVEAMGVAVDAGCDGTVVVRQRGKNIFATLRGVVCWY